MWCSGDLTPQRNPRHYQVLLLLLWLLPSGQSSWSRSLPHQLPLSCVVHVHVDSTDVNGCSLHCSYSGQSALVTNLRAYSYLLSRCHACLSAGFLCRRAGAVNTSNRRAV